MRAILPHFGNSPYQNGAVPRPHQRAPHPHHNYFGPEIKRLTAATVAVRPIRRTVGREPNISKPPFQMPTALLIPLLTATGLAGFWIFYKAVEIFDNI